MKAFSWTLTALLLCSVEFARVGAASDQIKLDVTPVRSVLKEGEKQTTWIRVGVEGFKLESAKHRPPVNLAIVSTTVSQVTRDPPRLKSARCSSISRSGTPWRKSAR